MPLSSTWERWLAAVLIMLFAVIAFGFSTGPILEGPDEIEHYRYVRHLAQKGTFPNATLPSETFHHPPLAFMLAAPISKLVGDADSDAILNRRNPYHLIHQVDEYNIPGNDNKNRLLHTHDETFPYTSSPTALTVHLIRLLSIGYGLGTLFAAWGIFRLLWPNNPLRRILALAIVSFWPQFIFMSSVISNDGLVYCLSTVSLYFVLRQAINGFTWRDAIWLGIALGAALLTKASALMLAAPVGLAILLNGRRVWKYGLLTLVLTLGIGGWWYVRNVMVYGDLMGFNAMYLSWPALQVQPGQMDTSQFLWQLERVYPRLWAFFGANTVAVSPVLYRFYDVLTVAVLIGLGLALVRSIRQSSIKSVLMSPGFLILSTTALLLGVALIQYTLQNWAGNQGRFLLPGISIWAALMAIGLEHLIPARIHLPVLLTIPTLMLTSVLVCLFGYFLPAYQPSPVPAQIEFPLSFRYGSVAELIGIDPPITRAQPGETVTITLYWRALGAGSETLQSYLHSTDMDVIRRDSLPATGNLLASDWQPGMMWAERYVITIPFDISSQTSSPLVAGLYDPVEAQSFDAIDSSGASVTPILGRIAINGEAEPIEQVVQFGGIAGMAQPEIHRDGDLIIVCARWVSLAETSVDYQFFVHLLDSSDQVVAQADFQPLEGRYPTSAWAQGEVVRSCASLTATGLPESGWRVALGIYDLATLARLPASGSGTIENDAVFFAP